MQAFCFFVFSFFRQAFEFWSCLDSQYLQLFPTQVLTKENLVCITAGVFFAWFYIYKWQRCKCRYGTVCDTKNGKVHFRSDKFALLTHLLLIPYSLQLVMQSCEKSTPNWDLSYDRILFHKYFTWTEWEDLGWVGWWKVLSLKWDPFLMLKGIWEVPYAPQFEISRSICQIPCCFSSIFHLHFLLIEQSSWWFSNKSKFIYLLFIY